MEKCSLIVITEDKKKYQLNPGSFKFELASKSSEAFEMDLSVIDRLTSSLQERSSLAKRFDFPVKIKECYIETPQKKRRLKPIFNSEKWLNITKKVYGDSFIDESRSVRESLISELPDFVFESGMYPKTIGNKFSTEDIIDDLVSDYLRGIREIKDIETDDFAINSTLVEENNENLELLNRALFRYEALRHIFSKRESFYEMIDEYESFYSEPDKTEKNSIETPSNKRGARYTMTAVNSNDEKYYYVLDQSRFVSSRDFKGGFVPKSSIQELDQFTSPLKKVSVLKGIPQDLKEIYISYQLNGEKRIPVIVNDSEWKEFVNEGDSKVDFKKKIARTIFYRVYYELANPESSFKDMLLNDEYEQYPPLTDELKSAVNFLASVVMVIDNDMKREGRVIIERGEKWNRSIGHDKVRKEATYYNNLRALHTNYKEYRKGGFRKEKSK